MLLFWQILSATTKMDHERKHNQWNLIMFKKENVSPKVLESLRVLLKLYSSWICANEDL